MAQRRTQKITPRALLEIKMPGDVQVASDNNRVVYSVRETDWDDNRMAQHLFIATVDGRTAPRQITRGESDETWPRWSPDGKWLAFLSTRGESDADEDFDEEDEPKQQVWLLPMDGLGGEAEKLTSATEGVGAYDWLPDSTGVAYLAREPRPKPVQMAYADRQERKDDAVVEREEKFREQIWEIDLETRKPRLIHPGDLGIGELAVSPDGRWIAFTTNYTGEVNDYHEVDVWTVERKTGKTQQLTEGPGGKFHPLWRPDGGAVLYLRSLDPALSYSQENLFTVPVTGGPSINLTEDFPHDLTGWHGVRFDAQGALYVSAALGTTTAIFRQSGGGFTPIIRANEHIHGFHVAPDGGIAFVASSSSETPEILWLAPGGDAPAALTDLNEAWSAAYRLAPTESVSWRSPDGLEIDGLLTTPIGFDPGKPSPLIITLHGGPHGREVQSLTRSAIAQVYAAEGYAVLAPNYRGSEGYGDAFGTANRGDLGGGDAQDVLAGVDWAIRRGLADPERLGIIGSSYGGYLTNWIISHTHRFRAAVSQFGIFSLITDFSNSQAPRWEQEYLGIPYWDAPEVYARHSPSTFVKDIETPVLILHGEGDPNTFIANSQEMYTALRLLGKTVQYVHYPREGHGFYEPQHRLDEMRRSVAWFDKYLCGGGRAVASRIGDKVAQGGWELTVVSAALVNFVGQAEARHRSVEIALVLRDIRETKAPLRLVPHDFSLAPVSAPEKGSRPAGIPVDVLGEKVLAAGAGWKFDFRPGKDERGLAVPLALAFRIPKTGGPYLLSVKDFPPVMLDIPAAEENPPQLSRSGREENRAGH